MRRPETYQPYYDMLRRNFLTREDALRKARTSRPAGTTAPSGAMH
jgi:hypothetical protein